MSARAVAESEAHSLLWLWGLSGLESRVVRPVVSRRAVPRKAFLHHPQRISVRVRDYDSVKQSKRLIATVITNKGDNISGCPCLMKTWRPSKTFDSAETANIEAFSGAYAQKLTPTALRSDAVSARTNQTPRTNAAASQCQPQVDIAPIAP